MKKKRYLFTSLFFLLLGGAIYLLQPESAKDPRLIFLLLCIIVATNYTIAYEVSDE